MTPLHQHREQAAELYFFNATNQAPAWVRFWIDTGYGPLALHHDTPESKATSRSMMTAFGRLERFAQALANANGSAGYHHVTERNRHEPRVGRHWQCILVDCDLSETELGILRTRLVLGGKLYVTFAL